MQSNARNSKLALLLSIVYIYLYIYIYIYIFKNVLKYLLEGIDNRIMHQKALSEKAYLTDRLHFRVRAYCNISQMT